MIEHGRHWTRLEVERLKQLVVDSDGGAKPIRVSGIPGAERCEGRLMRFIELPRIEQVTENVFAVSFCLEPAG
jgi:hypothetical protein